MAVVSGVLAFADRPVRELMTPRTAIVAFPEGILTAEAAHVLQQSGYSRYPVYRGRSMKWSASRTRSTCSADSRRIPSWCGRR